MLLALALSSLYKVLRVGKLLDFNIQQALFDLGQLFSEVIEFLSHLFLCLFFHDSGQCTCSVRMRIYLTKTGFFEK